MKTLKNLPLKLSLVLLFIAPMFMAAPAIADVPCGDNCSTNGGPSGDTNGVVGVNTSSSTTDNCSNTTTSGQVDNNKVGKCLDQSPIVHDIQNIVNFLSAAVGVVVIGVIILGGVQYSMAGDNSSALEAARKRITNGVVALVAFMFAWAFLQWLIPGGIFG